MNAPFIPAVASAMPPASGAPTRCADEAGAAGNLGIPQELLDAIDQLNDRQAFAVLGVLLDQHVPPSGLSEDFWEALEPVADAFDHNQVRIAVEMGWVS